MVFDREQKADQEVKFRTTFLRIVLASLEFLRWKPTQEAFTDLIESLFNDHSIIVRSMKFIIDTAIVQPPSMIEVPKTKVLSTPTTPSPRQSVQLPKYDVTQSDCSPPSRQKASSRVSSASRTPSSSASTSVRQNYNKHNTSNDQEISHYIQRESVSIFTENGTGSTEFNIQAFEILQRQNEVLSKQLSAVQKSLKKYN